MYIWEILKGLVGWIWVGMSPGTLDTHLKKNNMVRYWYNFKTGEIVCIYLPPSMIWAVVCIWFHWLETKHWYIPSLFLAVLLISIVVFDTKTLSLCCNSSPLKYHLMFVIGYPLTWHSISALSPLFTRCTLGCISASRGSTEIKTQSTTSNKDSKNLLNA